MFPDRQWFGADRRQGRSQRRGKQELWTLIGGSISEISSKPPKVPTATIDMRFVKNFTPPGFQAKDFTPLISLNFNSFSDKNTKNECFWRNLYHWQKIYTAGGSDKSHL